MTFYILYTVYLFDYFSILHTIGNNSNVGMRHNSQCIDLTISTRIHSTVIHGITGEVKKTDIIPFL